MAGFNSCILNKYIYLFIVFIYVTSIPTVDAFMYCSNNLYAFFSPYIVPVADIKAIVTGKDCPHMKEKGALKQNKVSSPKSMYPAIFNVLLFSCNASPELHIFLQ